MRSPCQSGRESRCFLETKDQRQSVMSDGTMLRSPSRHVYVQVQHPDVVLNSYQQRYSGSHKPEHKATDRRSGIAGELDHQKLPPGAGSSNEAISRQPGDRKSIATIVGNLAASSQAEESILVTPKELADVQMQQPEVRLKSYHGRNPGSYKHAGKAANGKSGTSVEFSHQSQRLTGTGSENGIVTRQPDHKKSLTTNDRNLTALSTVQESVLIRPTGESYHVQMRPVNNNNITMPSRGRGRNMTPATRHFTEAVKKGWTFKQVWLPKEKRELPKESPHIHTTYSSKFSPKKHKNGGSLKQNDRVNTIVINDGTSNQPIGHSCCLCVM